MSLTAPAVLSPDVATAVATNTISYALRFSDQDHAEFSLAGLTPPETKILSVRHDIGKNGEGRHVVRLDSSIPDSLQKVYTGSVYVNFVVPPSADFTAAAMAAMFNQLANWLSTSANANVTKILNSEV